MTHYILDCDDVLLDWQSGFIEYCISAGYDPDPAGPTSWSLSSWIGCSDSRASELVIEFNSSAAFASLKPMPASVAALRLLRRAGHTVSVMTCCGGSAQTRRDRVGNLQMVFGADMFTDIEILPLGARKFDALFKHGPNAVFVDDNFHHAQSGSIVGMRSYCTRRSHNRQQEADETDTKVIWVDDLYDALTLDMETVA